MHLRTFPEQEEEQRQTAQRQKKPSDDKKDNNKRAANKKLQLHLNQRKNKRSTTLRVTRKVCGLGEAMLDFPVSQSARNTPNQENHQSCVLPTSLTMSAANGATNVSCFTLKASMISNQTDQKLFGEEVKANSDVTWVNLSSTSGANPQSSHLACVFHTKNTYYAKHSLS